LPAGHTLATATLLTFNNASRPFESAQAADFLATSSQQDVYRVALSAGDRVTAAVAAQNAGSALDSLLRVFDGNGHQVAFNDNFNGRNPQLTFQASQEGDYYLTVAAANASNGRYELTLSREPGAALAPDLVSASLSVDHDVIVSGDALTITYAVENRGGAGTQTPFAVDFRLSQDNNVTASDLEVATRTVGPLGAGQSLTETFTVTLPAFNINQNSFNFNFPGLPSPPPGPTFRLGQVFLGVRVDAADAVGESNEAVSAGQHQGTDIVELSAGRAGTAPESPVSPIPGLVQPFPLPEDGRVSAQVGPGDVDLFDFRPPTDGILTIRVHGEGVDTRSALSEQDDSGNDFPLVQSDGLAGNPDDVIVQHVTGNGRYNLSVTSLAGQGNYTVTTEFRPALSPGQLLDVGEDPRGIVTADLNGDGVLDLVTANPTSHNLSILLGAGDGTFRDVDAVRRQPLTVSLDDDPVALAAGDFNHDGIQDLVVGALPFQSFPDNVKGPSELVLLLGNGDGTFTEAGRFENPGTLRAVTVGDFNGDGNLDVATANGGSNAVLVFLGDGTGQLEPIPDQNGEPLEFLVGGDPRALTTVQLNDDNGDGRIDSGDFLDLAVAVDLPGNLADNSAPGGVVLLRGLGDGFFAAPSAPLAVGEAPTALVAAQLNDDNGDGVIDQHDFVDLVTVNAATDFVTGDPNFKGDVSVLFGTGPGTFAPEVRLPAGFSPRGVVVGDFNNDGIPDIATANHDSLNATVLLGQQGRKFAAPLTFTVGAGPFALTTGDFDGDGRLDLAFANNGSSGNVAVLGGRGDGTFRDQVPNRVGAGPRAIVTADFNNDNRPDVATANADGTVSLLLGQGDGTFQLPVFVPVGAVPIALVVGDVNHDGRLDLVTANDNNTVSVLLGVGDGTFSDPVLYPVGKGPVSLALGDFNGDGKLDLVIAENASKDVALLLGNGDGTFQAPVFVPVGTASGTGPVALVVGSFNDDNGDGAVDGRDFLDVAVIGTAQDGAAELTVLLGNGRGGFTTRPTVDVGNNPTGLVVGQFDNDGFLDLALSSSTSEDIVVLPGDGKGGFGVTGSRHFLAFAQQQGITTGDFNGDGRPDIAISSGEVGNDFLLLSQPDGTFSPAFGLTSGETFALAAADFNGDGLDDLAGTTIFPNNVSIALATVADNGLIEFARADVSSDVRGTPILADVNGDGRTDSVVVANDGRILLRLRQANGQSFAPPILVNPGRPARAVTTVRVGGEVLLAATDQFLNPNTREPGNAITLYRISANGRPSVVGQLRIRGFFDDGSVANGSQLTRIVAADLNGDGIEDLAVLDQLNGHQRLSVFLGGGGTGSLATSATPGGFPTFGDDQGQTFDFLPTDLEDTGPVDLVARDVTGDGFLDLLLVNQVSGDVTVLVNEESGRSSDSVDLGSQVFRFRAGAGPFGDATGFTADSPDRTASLAIADFNGDGIPDVIAADPGTNSFAFLAGRGGGSFANPVVTRLSFSPSVVVAGQFNDDNGDHVIDNRDHADLAFLNERGETVSIFLGDGHGGFTEKVVRDASGTIIPLRSGNSPTGLSVADVNGDGLDDLQVGNAFGDVLTLLGNGDGTFQAARRANRDVPLATADFNGDGIPDALVANAAQDQVSLQLRVPGTSTFTQGSLVGTADAGLQAPVAPVLADLNGDDRPDMIVANSGGNTVTVFLRQADGSFVARSFFAGTGPSGLSVRDLNGDGIPDLIVANQGSNDVSILFGQGQGDAWTLIPGPRIRAGNGPISADVDANGDLMVVNGQDGTVSIIPSRGKGFFDDTSAQVRKLTDPATGTPPVIDEAAGGFLVTDSGAILHEATGATVFFDAGRQARAIDTVALAGGVGLVVAFSDGSLSLLTADAGGNFSPSQVLADTGLVDPSAVQILDDGERLEVYVTEAGDSVPFVFAFDRTAPESGVRSQESGVSEEGPGGSAVAASQTQVSDSTLNFVATLLGSGRLGATLSAVQGPPETEASVAPDALVGIGDNLGSSSSRSGSTEGSELPVEVWLPYLVDRVAQFTPNLAESITATEQGLAEAIAQATAAAAGPVGLALETVQAKDVPLVDPGLIPLAGEIGSELAAVGRDLAARFTSQVREQLQVEHPALPQPGSLGKPSVATSKTTGEPPVAAGVQDTERKETAQYGEVYSLDAKAIPRPAGLQASEVEAAGLEELFQRDTLMAVLLTSAVFASGFAHRPQREVRRQAPGLGSVRHGAVSGR
jgi:hypothetical protein